MNVPAPSGVPLSGLSSAQAPSSPRTSEPILEPDLPIVDAHHHLWWIGAGMLRKLEDGATTLLRSLAPVYCRHARYLLDEFAADARTHNVVASIFVDSQLAYRAEGDCHLRPVGEVECVNGIAALSASGAFGPARLCAGIVAGVTLHEGERVAEALEALLRAGGDRLKGVRASVSHDSDPEFSGHSWGDLLRSDDFRNGFARLQGYGLSFDAYVLEPQLGDLLALAQAFPGTSIILNHVGGPLGIGGFAGRRGERFPIWREAMRALARCDNVSVKLGGLGMPQAGFGPDAGRGPRASTTLADLWAPYFDVCIDAFGVARCMFESNYPVDSFACDYATLWNAFKRITAGASVEERDALFRTTALTKYRLPLTTGMSADSGPVSG